MTLTKVYPVWCIWRYWTLRAKVPSNVCKGSWEPGSRDSRISTRRELWGNHLTECGSRRECPEVACTFKHKVSTVSLSEAALGAVDGAAYWTALKKPAGQSCSFSKKRLFLCTETWCEVFNQSRLTPSTEQAICWWFDNFRHFGGGGWCSATKTWDLAVQPGGVRFPKCPPEGSRGGSGAQTDL